MNALLNKLENSKIYNDSHYEFLIKRINWHFNDFIIHKDEVDQEYKNLLLNHYNQHIDNLIIRYIQINVYKTGYGEKYLLMIKIDDLLAELWNI